MVDVTKLNKFVGMLGSEHDGERANAGRFIQKMAAAEKLSVVELLTKAYGGGSERVVERIVYRDRPTSAPPQEPPRRGPAPKSKAYGHNGSIVSKIRTILAYHSAHLTEWEKKFLEDIASKADTGFDMTPRQRASYAKIMEKCGYGSN